MVTTTWASRCSTLSPSSHKHERRVNATMKKYYARENAWWDVALSLIGLALLAIGLTVKHSFSLSLLGVTIVGVAIVFAWVQTHIENERTNALSEAKQQRVRREMRSLLRSMVLFLPLFVINSLNIDGPVSPCI